MEIEYMHRFDAICMCRTRVSVGVKSDQNSMHNWRVNAYISLPVRTEDLQIFSSEPFDNLERAGRVRWVRFDHFRNVLGSFHSGDVDPSTCAP